MVYALKKFRPYLGRKFQLLTDHSALTYMHTVKNLPDVLADWLDVLYEYDFDVSHIEGLANVLPDALSRLYPPEVWLKEASDDPDRFRLGRKKKAVKAVDGAAENGTEKSSNSKPKPAGAVQMTAIRRQPAEDLAKFIKMRLLKKMPEEAEERERLGKQGHKVSHCGGEQLFEQLWRQDYYWPTLRQECQEEVAACWPCIRYEVGRKGYNPAKFIAAKYPMDHTSVDLFSLNTVSPRGFSQVLVYTDIATRFVILRPLRSKEMKEVAVELLQIW